MKKMKLSDFKEYIKTNDENSYNSEGIGELFEDCKDKFALVCKKCGSMDIVIVGEDGCDYGEYTGYCPGTNVIKCKSCGNAITWFK